MSDNKRWWGRAAALLVTAGIVAIASPALALTKYTPDDAGKAYSNGDFVRVYDLEANGESVYSEYDVFGHLEQYRLEVTSGSGSSKDSHDFSDDGIERFNACENENNAFDECSSYYYF